MKKTFLLVAFMAFNFAIAQTNLINRKTVQTTTEMISIIIPIEGIVEFDGHTFDNNKSKDKIKLKATLEGIIISDKEREYIYRRCSKSNCKITHLEKKSYLLTNNLIYTTTNTKN